MSGPQPRVSSRDALLDALSLLLEADPEGTIPGVDAITAGAGLAHGTFYRYFPNKENALDSLVRRVRLEIASVRPRADKPRQPAMKPAARYAPG